MDHDKKQSRVLKKGSWAGFIVSIALFTVSIFVFGLIVSVPLTLENQFKLSVGLFILALFLSRFQGRLVGMGLIFISILVSSRYFYWRLTSTLEFNTTTGIDILFGILLISAEIFAFFTVLLGYFQGALPMNRKPTPLPNDTGQWPTVDIFIPTYNEPLPIVKKTILAAIDLEWPSEKKTIFLLDDGRREEFRLFAEEVGIEYLTRLDNNHAKAGNLNNALKHSKGALVTIFDCDHIPCRSFLKVSTGAFLIDSKLAFVQLPHHFYSPNPFERNPIISRLRRGEKEKDLFHGYLQDCHDTWNAVLFSGSCTVIRRSVLNEIGGIATETVTEDAHTSLKISRLGYHGHYINMVQAAGLSPSTVADHITQRMRWAMGMAQIFRLDNPLFGRGLKLEQRLVYLNTMLYFFWGLPRIVFLVAPLTFLYYEAHITQASAPMLSAFVFPHLLHSVIARSHQHETHSQSFWSETYETLISYYTMIPVLVAQILPKKGSFVVTPKGRKIKENHFDTSTAAPYLLLLFLNIFGFGLGIMRLVDWNIYESDTVIFCLVWTFYNTTILGGTVGLMWDRKEDRIDTRLRIRFKAKIVLLDGQIVECSTKDVTEHGIALIVPPIQVDPGNQITVSLLEGTAEEHFPAQVIAQKTGFLRLKFLKLSLDQERKLIRLTFGRPDLWASEEKEKSVSGGLPSFFSVLIFGWISIFQILMLSLRWLVRPVLPSFFQGAGQRIGFFLFALFLFCFLVFATLGHAETLPEKQGETEIETFFSLESLGMRKNIRLKQGETFNHLSISIRADRVVSDAQLSLYYLPTLNTNNGKGSLEVLVNNVLVSKLPMNASDLEEREASIGINPRLFSDKNDIVFRFVSPQPLSEIDWITILKNSMLSIKTKVISFPNDLSLLPLPFLDSEDQERPRISFVMPRHASLGTVRSAGIIASWFGTFSRHNGSNFNVSYDKLPMDNAVVFIHSDNAPNELSHLGVTSGKIILMDHPLVAYRKLLVIMGRNDQELIRVAQILSQPQKPLTGASFSAINWKGSPQEHPNKAPRWIPTDRPLTFAELKNNKILSVHGRNNEVIRLDFTLPPDLLLWGRSAIPAHLKYSHSSFSIGERTSLSVSVNGNPGGAFNLSRNVAGALLGQEKSQSNRVMFLSTEDFRDHNQIDFFFNLKSDQFSEQMSLDEIQAKLHSESTIDFSGFPHFSVLPDLSKFVKMGFPFTRYADLQDTAIVLPSTIDEPTMGSYLALLSGFGSMTGYPALFSIPINPKDIQNHKEKDLLILGNLKDPSLLQRWIQHMPLQAVVDYSTDNTTRWIDRMRIGIQRMIGYINGYDVRGEAKNAQQQLAVAGDHSALLMGFESPIQKGRSIVMLVSKDNDYLLKASSILQDSAYRESVQGDLVLIGEGNISSFHVGQTYYIGDLTLWNFWRFFFSGRPFLLLFLALILSFPAAYIFLRRIRNKAEMRLSLSYKETS